MSITSSNRHAKTERLQKFLHAYFKFSERNGQRKINGFLLVKYELPNSTKTRVEIYKLPLNQPHGRF